MDPHNYALIALAVPVLCVGMGIGMLWGRFLTHMEYRRWVKRSGCVEVWPAARSRRQKIDWGDE